MKTKIKKNWTELKKILLLVFVIIGAVGCSTDDSPAAVTFKVTGKVMDENNVPIVGAEVIFEDNSTTTTSSGEFIISSKKSQSQRQFIIVKSTNKFAAYRAFSNQGITEIDMQVMMMNKGTVVNFNSTSGVTIQNSGGSVTIPANAIQKENGEVYSGSVTASVRMLNPDQPNYERLMQGGDFAGVNASNQSGSLRSYGFYAAELEDESGNKLNIKDGLTASFRLPISTNDISVAPQTMKLWYFDKTKGIWIENGTATKVGNEYKGTVPHFSEWNCDDWYASTTVSGTWTQIPTVTSCSGGIDVVYVNLETNEQILIYNMPQASNGTFYFKNGAEAAGLQSCDLFILYNPGSSSSNIFFSVPSEAAGWIKKTGKKSFTFMCTLSDDYSNTTNPTSVRGINGSGTY